VAHIRARNRPNSNRSQDPTSIPGIGTQRRATANQTERVPVRYANLRGEIRSHPFARSRSVLFTLSPRARPFAQDAAARKVAADLREDLTTRGTSASPREPSWPNRIPPPWHNSCRPREEGPLALRNPDARAGLNRSLHSRAGLEANQRPSAPASWLQAKGLVKIEEASTPLVQLEKEGLEYARRGFRRCASISSSRAVAASFPSPTLRNKNP